MIDIDCRWEGLTGIGRYSRELTSRIVLAHKRVEGFNTPTSIMGICESIGTRKRKSDFFYSPGFMFFPGYSNQLVTIHDLIHLKDRKERNFAKQIYYQEFLRKKIISQRVSYIVNSEATKKEVMEWLGEDIPPMSVITPAVSNIFLSIPSVKSERSISNLLVVSNDSPHKNIDFLIQSLKFVESHVKLVTVGIQKPLEIGESFVEVEQNYQVSDSKLVSLYDQADLLIVPSLREGFCIPVLEAISRGLDVVHLGIVEQINTLIGKKIYIPVDPFDPVSFASCIDNALGEVRTKKRVIPNPNSLPTWNESANKLNMVLRSWSTNEQ